MSSPHTTPILILKWSKMGGRLISVDAVSSLEGLLVELVVYLNIYL